MLWSMSRIHQSFQAFVMCDCFWKIIPHPFHSSSLSTSWWKGGWPWKRTPFVPHQTLPLPSFYTFTSPNLSRPGAISFVAWIFSSLSFSSLPPFVLLKIPSPTPPLLLKISFLSSIFSHLLLLLHEVLHHDQYLSNVHAGNGKKSLDCHVSANVWSSYMIKVGKPHFLSKTQQP